MNKKTILRTLFLVSLMMLVACESAELKQERHMLNQEIKLTLAKANEAQQQCFKHCLASFKGDLFGAQSSCLRRLKRHIVRDYTPPDQLQGSCRGGHS